MGTTLTSNATNEHQDGAPHPPPPMNITDSAQCSVAPPAEASFRLRRGQIPAVPGRSPHGGHAMHPAPTKFPRLAQQASVDRRSVDDVLCLTGRAVGWAA